MEPTAARYEPAPPLGQQARAWALGCAAVLLTLIIAVVGGALWLMSGHRPVPKADALGRYRDACAPVIAWLEAERAASRAVPAELPEPHRAALAVLDPPARYVPHAGGFVIKIGDYSVKCPWAYYYESSARDWALDH